MGILIVIVCFLVFKETFISLKKNSGRQTINFGNCPGEGRRKEEKSHVV